MSNNDNSKKKTYFELKQDEELKQSGLVTNSVYNIYTYNVKISLNHKACADIIFTIDHKKWQNNLDIIAKEAKENGIEDTKSIRLLKNHLNDNHDMILFESNNVSGGGGAGGDEEKEKSKRKITTFKYSEIGKGDLYEAVLIEKGKPVFTKYNDKTNEFQVIDQIEETTRILVPPTFEECPYLRYEFENIDEINSYNKFIEQNNIDLDYLYVKGLEIVSKYNDQSKHKLRLVIIKIITSHFQDRFSTTEYLYPVGGNGSGKSSLAETFRALAYKTVVMTDPSAPNLFRLLGFVEPVQCTMVLEEADKIDKSPDLMAVLKTGSSYYGMVPKINPYTLKQESFYTYCPKIIVSERSLNQSIAKGVNSRTFPINCIKGSTKHDILEILNPTNTGGPENKKLLKELMDFRKLLLVYRLRHFKDPIPDLDIGVEGRDKQLVKHSIQLFNGCNCLKEVIETLQKFLDNKNEKKESSIESVLIPIIAGLVVEQDKDKDKDKEIIEISSAKIWWELMQEIPGKFNEDKPTEYLTNDYGIIYRTTISNLISDLFGAQIKHKRTGNVLIFDREVIERLATQDKTKITTNELQKGEGVNSVKAPDIGGSVKIEKSEAETQESEETIKGEQYSPNGPIHLEGEEKEV